MGEGVSEYMVVDYIDELEEAIYNAEKHEMVDITKGLNSLHDTLVDVGNMVDSEAKIKRLKADVEKPLEELVEACQAGDDGRARGAMRILRDKVNGVKAIWSKE